jgi:hypothetical protein
MFVCLYFACLFVFMFVCLKILRFFRSRLDTRRNEIRRSDFRGADFFVFGGSKNCSFTSCDCTVSNNKQASKLTEKQTKNKRKQMSTDYEQILLLLFLYPSSVLKRMFIYLRMTQLVVRFYFLRFRCQNCRQGCLCLCLFILFVCFACFGFFVHVLANDAKINK